MNKSRLLVAETLELYSLNKGHTFGDRLLQDKSPHCNEKQRCSSNEQSMCQRGMMNSLQMLNTQMLNCKLQSFDSFCCMQVTCQVTPRMIRFGSMFAAKEHGQIALLKLASALQFGYWCGVLGITSLVCWHVSGVDTWFFLLLRSQ